MSKRDIGMEILEGIREIKAYKAGQANLRTCTLKHPAPAQVIRAKLNLSQEAFAGSRVARLVCRLKEIKHEEW